RFEILLRVFRSRSTVLVDRLPAPGDFLAKLPRADGEAVLRRRRKRRRPPQDRLRERPEDVWPSSVGPSIFKPGDVWHSAVAQTSSSWPALLPLKCRPFLRADRLHFSTLLGEQPFGDAKGSVATASIDRPQGSGPRRALDGHKTE